MAKPVEDGFLPFSLEGFPSPTLKVGKKDEEAQISLENANFGLEPNRKVLFSGNGQINAVGDLSFLTAGTPTVPALTIFANGNVGIGTGTRQPTDKLEIAGSLKLETGLSVNQFSGDITDSDQVVPTAKAVKTYVDSKPSPELPDGSVTDRKIANDAITTDKIQDKSITAAKLNFSISPESSQWEGVDGGPISYTKGNVGIGTATPKSLLEIRKDVSGKLGPVLTLQNNLGSAGAGAAIDFNGYEVGQNDPTARIQSLDDGNFSSHIAFYTKQSGAATNKLQERLRIQSDGNVGIGIGTPSAKLHIYEPINAAGEGGNIKFFDKGSKYKYEVSYDGGSDGQFNFTNTGIASGETRFQTPSKVILTIKNNGDVSGKFVQPSSRELKENITDFSTEEAIEALANLNPVKFNYREDNQKQLKAGFIAEDVPELVATADRKAIYALDIVAVLTKVIQQQQEELSCLKERLNALEARA